MSFMNFMKQFVWSVLVVAIGVIALLILFPLCFCLAWNPMVGLGLNFVNPYLTVGEIICIYLAALLIPFAYLCLMNFMRRRRFIFLPICFVMPVAFLVFAVGLRIWTPSVLNFGEGIHWQVIMFDVALVIICVINIAGLIFFRRKEAHGG